MVEECTKYDINTANQMLKTIKPLLSKADILCKIKNMYDVKYSLVISPKIRFDKSTPYLSPSREIIKFCYETDTDIVYDLYVCCPDNFEDGMIWEE